MIPDVRALCTVQVIPSFLAVILFDAQPRPMRKHGVYYFTGGILFLFCWMAGLYFNLAQDLNIFEISLPGALVSVSSVQLFLSAPIVNLIPYFARFSFNSVFSPHVLPCLQSSLEEKEYKNLDDFVAWLETRQERRRTKIQNLRIKEALEDGAKSTSAGG